MTPLQKQLYDFLRERIERTGVCPSYNEMGAHMGCVKSSIHRLVYALERQKKIRKLPRAIRSIEIMPDNTERHKAARASSHEIRRVMTGAADAWLSRKVLANLDVIDAALSGDP